MRRMLRTLQTKENVCWEIESWRWCQITQHNHKEKTSTIYWAKSIIFLFIACDTIFIADICDKWVTDDVLMECCIDIECVMLQHSLWCCRYDTIKEFIMFAFEFSFMVVSSLYAVWMLDVACVYIKCWILVVSSLNVGCV